MEIKVNNFIEILIDDKKLCLNKEEAEQLYNSLKKALNKNNEYLPASPYLPVSPYTPDLTPPWKVTYTI